MAVVRSERATFGLSTAQNNTTKKSMMRDELFGPRVSPCVLLLLATVVLGLNVFSLLGTQAIQASQKDVSVFQQRRIDSVLDSKSTLNPSVQSESALRKKDPLPKQQLFRPIPKRPAGINYDLVKAGDYIYYDDPIVPRWDASPVVLESHKLIFFTIPKVGCTVWKQLFRRMMGYADWQSQDYSQYMPHNPASNGLKYLNNFTLREASIMMTSPEWTRAIMVRNPKRRFLSAFLDKSISNDHVHIRHRCCPDGTCIKRAQTITGFLELCKRCNDEHWRGQHERMESKYWPYIDWVGHVETAEVDAKNLLERIGAWEEYGSTGWGEDGNSAIFHVRDVAGAGEHATWSTWKHWEWYTPETELAVENFFQNDYTNPLLNFTRGQCWTCSASNSRK